MTLGARPRLRAQPHMSPSASHLDKPLGFRIEARALGHAEGPVTPIPPKRL